ncbi:heme o synthase [Mammaliicoccus sciuri]|uniref:Protoheme IX farnesyltransferase n=2 Tax=Sporosarcina newyorkensis TaxID=759851 RepID=A0A1T4YKJ8_9BACL|nr:heme o synthase [Sporosarcina newyorkensis]EGQ21829.1 protoheme IX farnesyltransferase [Sporosarcina newyorkensis 2681]SKB02377.1 protoheme IX farnesyltransferase [Sporosarcina newyorkensis]
MTKEVHIVSTTTQSRSASAFFSDIKSLVKGPVLIANVLPVFAGFWLALHFSGMTLAGNWGVFWLTMVGSTFLMAGALVLNNWFDSDIDTFMERTQQRPTVTGNFALKTVLNIGLVLSGIGMLLLLFTTFEAALYAFIGWFTYVIPYTMWSKRKYTLNTVIGSVSGAVTPLIGWAAIMSANHIVPIVLFSILFIWQMPHTFAIAMKKHDEYKAANVPMLPVVCGFDFTKRQMLIYVLCLLPFPFLLPMFGMGFIIVATLMNVGYIAASIYGFYAKDNHKWAHVMFLYSVNYMTLLFMMMILLTF